MDKIASEATNLDGLGGIGGHVQYYFDSCKPYYRQHMDYKTYLHLASTTHIGALPNRTEEELRGFAGHEGTVREW